MIWLSGMAEHKHIANPSCWEKALLSWIDFQKDDSSHGSMLALKIYKQWKLDNDMLN